MIYIGLHPLYLMSLFTFALFGFDKHRAVYGLRRVPEWLLLLCSFCFGAFGGLVAMLLFNHKTRHLKFTLLVPLFLALQLTIEVLQRMLWDALYYC